MSGPTKPMTNCRPQKSHFRKFSVLAVDIEPKKWTFAFDFFSSNALTRPTRPDMVIIASGNVLQPDVPDSRISNQM